MAYTKLADGRIIDDKGGLVAGAPINGVYTSVKNAQGQQLTGLDDKGELTFGGLAQPAEPDITAGLSASTPAVNEDEIRRQTQSQFGPQRQSIEQRFNAKISSAEGLRQDQKRSLEGQMGIGRRFSSSAVAFIQHVDETAKKEIAELEIQREDALSTFDFEMAQMVDRRIAQKKLDQQQQFENMFKLMDYAEKQEKGNEEKLKAGVQSERDSAIASLMMAGLTDPLKIIKALNFDENGEMVGDFTSEEINKAFKNLSIDSKPENLPADLETFNYLQKNNMLPGNIQDLPEQDQYFAYLNMMKLANSGKLSAAGKMYAGGLAKVSVGVGAANSTEESIIRTRLFAKLATILNKGTLSDADREIIESRISEFRDAGMSEQEIMSQLAGFPADVNTPYNASFITLASANTDTNAEQQELMGKLGILMANGDYTTAMDTIERKAMEKAYEQAGDKDQFVSIDDVVYTKKKVDDIAKLLGTGWSNEVGAFSGSMSLFLSRKFGIGQASTMRAKLGSLTASMINKRAGSAITEEEWKRLVEPNIPSMGDSAATWGIKMNELVDNVVLRLNSERSTVSLPQITTEQAIDKEKRLELYAQPDKARTKHEAAKTQITQAGLTDPAIQEATRAYFNENPGGSYDELLLILGI